MASPTTYDVQAFNTATASTNRIHDDAVARQFGFGGGLVPGVDVYAYLTHLPARAWGIDWLTRGTMSARFHQPVYDGEEVRVSATPAGGGTLELELRNPGGVVCASGSASLPAEAVERPDASRWPGVAQVAVRPPAAPDTLREGTAFGLAPHTFHADRAGEYLDDVREPLALYRDEGVAHPGWLLRDANYVLSANVELGPWIHVSSDAVHHAAVRDGQVVSARATVTSEWEHKGHRFVALDVAVLADDLVAVHVQHTAIYRPRQVAGG